MSEKDPSTPFDPNELLLLIRRSALAVLTCGGVAAIASLPIVFGRAVPLVKRAEAWEVECLEVWCEEDDAWTPRTESIRDVATLTSCFIVGFGYACILLSLVLARGARIGANEGFYVGLACFFAFQLFPALALPPEIPGMTAASVSARQNWWLAEAICTLLGGFVAFDHVAKQALYKYLGRTILPNVDSCGATAARLAVAALIALTPLFIGAPQPEKRFESVVPAELAAEFGVAALLTTLVFWLVLGTAVGVTAGKVDPALAHQNSNDGGSAAMLGGEPLGGEPTSASTTGVDIEMNRTDA